MLFGFDEKKEEDLFVGTSGFSFPDWIGKVYPDGLSKGRMFDYYVKIWRFNALEVNFTYYSSPSKRTIISFLRRSPENFMFIFKAPKLITHDAWKKGEMEEVKKNIEDFLRILEPLKSGGKLGGILLQFPYSFKRSSVNIDYLGAVSMDFKDGNVDIFIEFRNVSWAVKDTFDFLRSIDSNYVIVDEPRLPGLFPYIPGFTGDIAYFRFHGRNERWFEADGSERYDYLYSSEELEKLADDVKKIRKNAKKTFIFFNNCHNGSAVKNALEFRELLT